MTTLKNWEQATEQLAQSFIKKHFGRSASYYWISDEVGGTLEVADRYFSLADIVDFTRGKYTSEEVYDYYDYALGLAMKNSEQDSKKKNNVIINIRNWKKLCKKHK